MMTAKEIKSYMESKDGGIFCHWALKALENHEPKALIAGEFRDGKSFCALGALANARSSNFTNNASSVYDILKEVPSGILDIIRIENDDCGMQPESGETRYDRMLTFFKFFARSASKRKKMKDAIKNLCSALAKFRNNLTAYESNHKKKKPYIANLIEWSKDLEKSITNVYPLSDFHEVEMDIKFMIDSMRKHHPPITLIDVISRYLDFVKTAPFDKEKRDAHLEYIKKAYYR